MNLDSTFSSLVDRVGALLCTFADSSAVGAMSQVSAACSMVVRLGNYVSDTGGILTEDQATGVYKVTEMMVKLCAQLADLLGGAVLVAGTELKGERYGDCELDEDVVLLLGQCAQGKYVLRALYASRHGSWPWRPRRCRRAR